MVSENVVSQNEAAPFVDDAMQSTGGYDSDEDYDSDLEQPGITTDRARRKLSSAITGAELDLVTLPDFDHPSDENYNVQAALPIIGCAKLYLVEICEGIKWYGEFLSADGDAPVDDTETLVRMYHGMQKQGRNLIVLELSTSIFMMS